MSVNSVQSWSRTTTHESIPCAFSVLTIVAFSGGEIADRFRPSGDHVFVFLTDRSLTVIKKKIQKQTLPAWAWREIRVRMRLAPPTGQDGDLPLCEDFSWRNREPGATYHRYKGNSNENRTLLRAVTWVIQIDLGILLMWKRTDWEKRQAWAVDARARACGLMTRHRSMDTDGAYIYYGMNRNRGVTAPSLWECVAMRDCVWLTERAPSPPLPSTRAQSAHRARFGPHALSVVWLSNPLSSESE